jgi:hypothetical protein
VVGIGAAWQGPERSYGSHVEGLLECAPCSVLVVRGADVEVLPNHTGFLQILPQEL